MMDNDKRIELLELLEEAATELDNAKDEAYDAYEKAGYARSSANDAYDSAAAAESNADEAEDAAARARDYVCDVLEKLDTIREMLEQEAPEDGEKSLKADVRKHKDRVQTFHRQGSSVAAIAKHLGITEFLVQVCIDELSREAA